MLPPLIDEDDGLSDPLPDGPGPLLARWFDEARTCEQIRNPDAIALATTDADGAPDVRIVLCRGLDASAGRFEFFTHYDSPKGRALDATGRASAVLHWDPLGRQVRFAGRVERSPRARSDDYFAGRPALSQLSAWASRQSEPVADRRALEARMEATRERFREAEAADTIPRPPEWGGYVLIAERVELWKSRAGRLHDRGCWTRSLGDGTAAPGGRWVATRLQP